MQKLINVAIILNILYNYFDDTTIIFRSVSSKIFRYDLGSIKKFIGLQNSNSCNFVKNLQTKFKFKFKKSFKAQNLYFRKILPIQNRFFLNILKIYCYCSTF